MNFDTKRRISWGVGLCGGLLNSLLFVIAILQVLIALLILLEKEIPLPEFVLRDLGRKLDRIGAEFEIGEFTFDTSGHLYAHDLKLYRKETRDLLMESERVIIALELPMLLIRKAVAEELKIRNARMICPALYSLSGSDEAIARKINGSFVNTVRGWEIRQLSLLLHDLQVRIRGPLPEAALRTEGRFPPGMREATIKRYLEFCRALSELQKPLTALEDATASLKLSKIRGVPPFLEADLIGGGLNWPDLPHFGRFHLHAPKIDIFTLYLPQPITGQAASVETDGEIGTGPIRFQVEAESILRKGIEGLQRLLFSAPESYSYAFSGASLSGRLQLEEYPSIEGRAVLGLKGGPLMIRGEIDTEKGSGRLALHSEANLNLLKEIAALSKYRFLQSIEFPESSQLRADLQIDDAYAFSNMKFSFRSDSFRFGGAGFSHFRMDGTIDPDSIQCRRIEFEQSGYRTEGSILGDFTTGQTRILLKGRLYPAELNPTLPEWWAKTWKDFLFFDQPPYGDVEFRSNWREGRLLFHYGAIAGQNLSYRGMDISEIRLHSWARPGFLELFQIESQRPEGEGTGSMQWTFRERKNVARSLDIATHFHLASLSALLGAEAASFVDDFEVTAPPFLKIKGTLYDRAAPPSRQRALRVQAESGGPLNYRQLSFDRLAFDANLASDSFSVDSLSFGLAGGTGKGRLEWKQDQSNGSMEVDLSLRGADSDRFLEMLGLEENPAATSAKNSPESIKAGSPPSGTVDVDLKAKGNTNDFLDFKGSGWLRMTQEGLGRIHLFGGLSRLFYGSWIGFTTLRLERAEGYFLLDRNLLSFPDLRFYGPNALVQASGDLRFPHHEIDFKIKVKYLERAVNPISTALSPLFKPLVDSLEVDLWGTIAKPEWRFLMDPSNIFATPSVSSRPIDPFSQEVEEEPEIQIP